MAAVDDEDFDLTGVERVRSLIGRLTAAGVPSIEARKLVVDLDVANYLPSDRYGDPDDALATLAATGLSYVDLRLVVRSGDMLSVADAVRHGLGPRPVSLAAGDWSLHALLDVIDAGVPLDVVNDMCADPARTVMNFRDVARMVHAGAPAAALAPIASSGGRGELALAMRDLGLSWDDVAWVASRPGVKLGFGFDPFGSPPRDGVLPAVTEQVRRVACAVALLAEVPVELAVVVAQAAVSGGWAETFVALLGDPERDRLDALLAARALDAAEFLPSRRPEPVSWRVPSALAGVRPRPGVLEADLSDDEATLLAESGLSFAEVASLLEAGAAMEAAIDAVLRLPYLSSFTSSWPNPMPWAASTRTWLVAALNRGVAVEDILMLADIQVDAGRRLGLDDACLVAAFDVRYADVARWAAIGMDVPLMGLMREFGVPEDRAQDWSHRLLAETQAGYRYLLLLSCGVPWDRVVELSPALGKYPVPRMAGLREPFSVEVLELLRSRNAAVTDVIGWSTAEVTGSRLPLDVIDATVRLAQVCPEGTGPAGEAFERFDALLLIGAAVAGMPWADRVLDGVPVTDLPGMVGYLCDAIARGSRGRTVALNRPPAAPDAPSHGRP